MSHEGETLRSSAIRKLNQAQALLNSARKDLCNLEGPGYCDQYEKLGETECELDQFTSKLCSMPLPTGVFKIDA